MNLFCVGLSHHTANVQTRERFAGSAGAERTLRTAGCAEALVLATCNRVEVYGASEKRVSTDEIAQSLLQNSEVSDGGHTSALPFYRYEAEKCVQHLFRVASGLDSMIVGETEILGQTKKAYQSARASGAVGPCLHRLFQRAFRVAKQVRTRTEITRGSVSVGSVAVDLAQKIFGELGNCKVLILGAGETSERTARALISRGVSDLRVSNRSNDRGSTSSETPLLTPTNLEPMLANRVDRPLFIIDIAVPRDVDPAVNEMEGVYLYDIDALRSVAEQSLAVRRQQMASAEAIIAEHVADFLEKVSSQLNRVSRITGRPPVADSSLHPSQH